MTVDIQGMMDAQGGVCPICERELTHESAKIQMTSDGEFHLLCRGCQNLIGCFGVNPAITQDMAILQRAIDYYKNW